MPDEFREDLDLLILIGGSDLSTTNKAFLPKLNYAHTQTDSYIEFFRTFLLESYIENEIPIFGICLGFQMLAAHFGSKMLPDISGHNEHLHTVKSAEYELKLNSFHHQCVSKLADCLEPIAYALNKDGLEECVEAFKHKSLPIAGVQHHPERMDNLLSSQTYKMTGHLVGDLITHSLINQIIDKA